MVSITFKDYEKPEHFVRDSPGIIVKDYRLSQWVRDFDDLVNSASYTYSPAKAKGIKVFLEWSKDSGYTSSISIEGAKIELQKNFTRQHIDIAKGVAIDHAFEFLMGKAEEIDPEAYDEATENLE